MSTDYGECKNLAHAPRQRGATWVCPDCDKARAAEAEARALVEARAAAHVAAEGKVTEAEWRTFLAAIKQVAAENGGEVDANKVRPLVRGRIEPKHIGTAFAVAKKAELIERIGINESTDVAGKNAGRPQPLYRLRVAA